MISFIPASAADDSINPNGIKTHLAIGLNTISLNLFRMGLFRAADGWRRGIPFTKVCHIYPTIMKLATVIPYLKKIEKIYESHDTSPKFS